MGLIDGVPVMMSHKFKLHENTYRRWKAFIKLCGNGERPHDRMNKLIKIDLQIMENNLERVREKYGRARDNGEQHDAEQGATEGTAQVSCS